MTGSMERAIAETNRRRSKQEAYNLEHGITPASIRSHIKDILASPYERQGRLNVDAGVAEDGARPFLGDNFKATLRDLENRMRTAAANLEFEEAARLRDEVKRLKLLDLAFAHDALSDGRSGKREDVKIVRAELKAENAEKIRKTGKARRR